MGEVYFYHITRNPLHVTLGTLIDRSLAADWRVEVRGTSPDALSALSARLWERDGFLAHGIAGGEHDSDQPVLLTTMTGANDATCLMSIGGADVTPDEIGRLERTCILFDGHAPDAVQTARRQWKTLTDAGCAAQYWSEESGRWTKKA